MNTVCKKILSIFMISVFVLTIGCSSNEDSAVSSTNMSDSDLQQYLEKYNSYDGYDFSLLPTYSVALKEEATLSNMFIKVDGILLPMNCKYSVDDILSIFPNNSYSYILYGDDDTQLTDDLNADYILPEDSASLVVYAKDNTKIASFVFLNEEDIANVALKNCIALFKDVNTDKLELPDVNMDDFSNWTGDDIEEYLASQNAEKLDFMDTSYASANGVIAQETESARHEYIDSLNISTLSDYNDKLSQKMFYWNDESQYTQYNHDYYEYQIYVYSPTNIFYMNYGEVQYFNLLIYFHVFPDEQKVSFHYFWRGSVGFHMN